MRTMRDPLYQMYKQVKTEKGYKKYGMNDTLLFGQFSGLSVKDLLAFNRGVDYLVWADSCVDIFDLKPYARKKVEQCVIAQLKREQKLKTGYLLNILQKAGV